MSLDVILYGGPWDGLVVAVDAHAAVVRLPNPPEKASSVDKIDLWAPSHMAVHKVSFHEYVRKDLWLGGARIAMLCYRDNGVAAPDPSAMIKKVFQFYVDHMKTDGIRI